MEAPEAETIIVATEILATEGITEDEREARIRALVPDELTAVRLLDVIPEAFGLVLIAHLVPPGTMTLPATFSARTEAGDWEDIAMTREPIFTVAVDFAMHTFHNGPRNLFKNVSERSALTATINNALNAGCSLQALQGSTLKGPQFFGISAEIYR